MTQERHMVEMYTEAMEYSLHYFHCHQKGESFRFLGADMKFCPFCGEEFEEESTRVER